MSNTIPFYTSRLAVFNNEKQYISKKQHALPMSRLSLFLTLLVFIYIYLTTQQLWSAIIIFALIATFIVISVFDNKLKKQITHLNILISINEKELSALQGDYSIYDPGNEFVDPSHDYTHDLDIFGQGSLFQFINRTATVFGKFRLADYFKNAFDFGNQVNERQIAIKDLAQRIDLRQELQFIFQGENIQKSDKEEIIQWLENKSPVKNILLLKILAYGLPSVTVGWILLSVFSILPFPVIMVLAQLMIVFLYGKQTITVQSIITSKSKILNKYSQSLVLFENTSFESPLLVGLQHKLVGHTGLNPSKAIKNLSVILKYMDTNLNLLVAIMLNSLFMFNLHMLLKVEKWKSINREHVPDWFETIATFDAISSLGNFLFNHPDYVFPEVQTDGFKYNATSLGHPLIAADQRIVNDIDINGWNQFYIITGANMSGKSTFLRTIGVNYILAMIGAPVCAARLHFSPVEIHSSIRTSDSLVKHESYFYAELKRLKEIIDELRSGKRKLVLLDEILKGTNSKDKQAGSIALIEQLLHYQSVGLFATHDLVLGELASRYPGHVNNLCFEIDIADDKMVIDYKLHHGVCKNLNATFLMKNMGILLES